MPTYDYICEKCGDRFEHFQKMSSEPLTVCSKCGGHLKRLIGSGVGIIFKGSGFYCTDYRKGGSSSSSEPKSETKTETKAEAPKNEPSKAPESKPSTTGTSAAS
ncbi:MAG: FmdB family transcriptional regulator [Victivallales bacterium]|nr:FmdB family transcriptional regulator [Victivallales bacterium]